MQPCSNSTNTDWPSHPSICNHSKLTMDSLHRRKASLCSVRTLTIIISTSNLPPYLIRARLWTNLGREERICVSHLEMWCGSSKIPMLLSRGLCYTHNRLWAFRTRLRTCLEALEPRLPLRAVESVKVWSWSRFKRNNAASRATTRGMGSLRPALAACLSMMDMPMHLQHNKSPLSIIATIKLCLRRRETHISLCSSVMKKMIVTSSHQYITWEVLVWDHHRCIHSNTSY